MCTGSRGARVNGRQASRTGLWLVDPDKALRRSLSTASPALCPFFYWHVIPLLKHDCAGTLLLRLPRGCATQANLSQRGSSTNTPAPPLRACRACPCPCPCCLWCRLRHTHRAPAMAAHAPDGAPLPATRLSQDYGSSLPSRSIFLLPDGQPRQMMFPRERVRHVAQRAPRSAGRVTDARHSTRPVAGIPFGIPAI